MYYRNPFRIRIYRDMMMDSTVVCRRALGCEWGSNAEASSGTEDDQRTFRMSAEKSAHRNSLAELQVSSKGALLTYGIRNTDDA